MFWLFILYCSSRFNKSLPKLSAVTYSWPHLQWHYFKGPFGYHYRRILLNLSKILLIALLREVIFEKIKRTNCRQWHCFKLVTKENKFYHQALTARSLTVHCREVKLLLVAKLGGEFRLNKKPFSFVKKSKLKNLSLMTTWQWRHQPIYNTHLGEMINRSSFHVCTPSRFVGVNANVRRLYWQNSALYIRLLNSSRVACTAFYQYVKMEGIGLGFFAKNASSSLF